VFEFVQRFFGKPASSTTAKERLRLVLLSDHLSLAPDVVEALKRDLVEVISRYVEVDSSNCDVTFEQQDKQVAMLANIPILAMRENRPRATGPQPPAAPPPAAPEPPPARAPEPPSFGAAGASAAVAHEPEPDQQPELALEAQAVSNGSTTDGGAAAEDGPSGRSRAQRRKRRKRAAATGSASPQPT
jgi:cell division topological specificity factor